MRIVSSITAIILLAMLLLSPIACSKKGKEITTPDVINIPDGRIPASNLQDVALVDVLRMDCKTGNIYNIDRAAALAELDQLDFTSIEVEYDLDAVDTNYNLAQQAYQGNIISTDEQSISVRFTLTVSNLTDQYLTCPRAIFIPLPVEDGGSGYRTYLANADANLHLDMSEYETGLAGSLDEINGFGCLRIVYSSNPANPVWELKPTDENDVDDTSNDIACHIVIEGQGLPNFIDWVLIYDGILQSSSNDEIFSDPYSLSQIKITRASEVDEYYDQMWDLDIIREHPGSDNPPIPPASDIFDIEVVLGLPEADENDFNKDKYIVFLNNNEYYTFDYDGSNSGDNEALYRIQNLTVPDVLGAFQEDNGMFPFKISVRYFEDGSRYMSKEFDIPVIFTQYVEPEDLQDAGYYIIGAVTTDPSPEIVTTIKLMNSFTREIQQPADIDIVGDMYGGILRGVSDLSMQKALGGSGNNHFRIAYQIPDPEVTQQHQVTVWDWDPDNSPVGDELHSFDNALGSHGHPGLVDGLSGSNSLDRRKPCLDPFAEIILYMGEGRSYGSPDEYSSDPKQQYTYKDFWSVYDGYGNTWNSTLNPKPEGTNENIHCFDPPGHESNRCGHEEQNDYQDANWLMSPSVSGPVDMIRPGTDGLGGNKWTGVYISVFSKGSDCGGDEGEGVTILAFYIFKVFDDGQYYDFFELPGAPDGHGSNPYYFLSNGAGSQINPVEYSIGIHTGYEYHLLNPVISKDGTTVIFEASDGFSSVLYKINLNLDCQEGEEFISDSIRVGMVPFNGQQQFRAAVNSSYWDAEAGFLQNLPVDIIAYQDGIDNGTDIWVALENGMGSIYRINVTSPFIFDYAGYSGFPDIATKLIEFDGVEYIRSGLVFSSQKYDQGDMYLIDNVWLPTNPISEHWTKMRRMTNFGYALEVKISDFIQIK